MPTYTIQVSTDEVPAMNYYRRHIGDYMRDTAHLTLIEHGIYNKLLDYYYLHERPLPHDEIAQLIGVRGSRNRYKLFTLLHAYFLKTETGWVHKRAEAEIAESRRRIESARENGQLGGRPKTKKQNPAGSDEKPSGQANQCKTLKPLSELPARELEKDTRDSKNAAPLQRETAVCLLLNHAGIQATLAQCRSAEAAEAMAQPDDDWLAAIATAQLRKPGEQIGLRYLLPIMADMRKPPAPARPAQHATPTTKDASRKAAAAAIFGTNETEGRTNGTAIDGDFHRIG